MKWKYNRKFIRAFFRFFFLCNCFFLWPELPVSKWENKPITNTDQETDQKPFVAQIHVGKSLNRNKIAFKTDCFQHNRPVYWGVVVEQVRDPDIGIVEVAVYKDHELLFIKNVKILPYKKYYWFRSIFKIGKYRLELLDKNNHIQKLKIFEVVY